MRLLVVEDEKRIAAALKEGLEQESYAVDVEADGDDGFAAAGSGDYDLVILDIMMPGLDGVSVCKKLRAEGKKMPILMLTARGQNRDIVEALDAGADDYLVKPFSFEVLLARVRALLRRPTSKASETLSSDDLTLDPAAHKVSRAGREIMLSSKEYALLEYLLRNKGQVLSKNNLIAHVWDFDADILPNTVEVFIAYLRAKIDKPFKGRPALISTVRGFGYRLEDK